ncbi:hypothetical protein BHM03_00008036 [Ensete ventricosum]|nr:hypothetical protein BHM03_00008036 [Ensete ventricosum]
MSPRLARVTSSRASFPIEWTSRTVSSSVLALSADETELVEILHRILSVSRRVKDMNETYCAEMFNLGKMKSGGGAGSGSNDFVSNQRTCSRGCWVSTVEKRPSSGTEVGLRKRLRKVATEQPVDASGALQGPLPTRAKERWNSGRSLAGGALHPTLAKQVYERSSEELMNWAGKSTVWVRTSAKPSFSSPLVFSSITFVYLQGLHFVSALIDLVHDADRLVRSQHEKILALRAANKELKASVVQELTAAVER